MEKLLQKRVVVFIVFVMLIGVVAACSSSNNNSGNGNEQTPNTSQPNTTTPSNTAEEEEEVIELSWLGFYPPDTDDTPVQKYLEEKFNVKITPFRIDRSNWSEQLNLKLAAQEIPDVFFLWNRPEIDTYKQQGLLATMPVEEIRQKMPGYAATVDAWDAPYLWDSSTIDGENYAVPLYWPDGATPNLLAYNGNFLKAVGYNEPPKNLDEFEDVLTKIRNNDPDGNGAKDTYGMSARGKDALNQAFRTIFYAHQIEAFTWIEDPANPGQATRGIVTENAREALKYIHRLYQNDVINPEFITEDIAQSRQLFANQKIGVLDGGLWYHLLPNGGNWGQDFRELNPDNELVLGPQLDGPYGPAIPWVGHLGNNFIGMGVQVEQDQKKKDKIYEILEALAMDDEVYKAAVFGFEGESYDLVDGVIKMKPEYQDVVERGAKFGAGPFFGFFDNKSTPMRKYNSPPADIEFRAMAMATSPNLRARLDTMIVPAKDDYPDLSTLEREYMVNFITGSLNLEEDFDNFVELWRRSGGQAIQDQLNELLNQ